MHFVRPVDKDCWPIPLRHLDPERHVWIIDQKAGEYVVMLRQFRIYLLTCRPTGERYVGVTESHPRERLDDHVFTAFHPKRRKTLIQKAIAEHGVDAFDVETIGIANSISDALETERQMILKYRTLVEEGGLNACLGGGRVGPTRLGYHYLGLYERGEARVVQRIPRIVKERKRKATGPIKDASKHSHLRLVESQKAVVDEEMRAMFPWMEELQRD